MPKLSKEQLEKKKKYHEKKVEYYEKKINEAEAESKRIGFRYCHIRRG